MPGHHVKAFPVRNGDVPGRPLCSTGRPLEAIAREAGYDTPANFSKTFRRVMGLPPSEFRRKRPRA
jgi:transcriptional regulator GlxA family with amidase domain